MSVKNLNNLFRGNSFTKDIIILLIVSIIIGSLLAGSVSFAANKYFSKAVASLVGDYGEYDLVIQCREDMKDDTYVHLQKIIGEVFPGAKLKEGPTITGKTNFFIALPDEYKTKAIFENLGKTFGSIPGGAGVGVMTEPRLIIRGVPEGAKNMLIDAIGKMQGVRFAFRDGASVGVVLTSVNSAPQVSENIKALLNQYQVIEITFPVGSEPSNPIKLGEDIAKMMKNDLRLEFAQNVSVDGKNDDMTYTVSTMMELKRFLSAYASQVVVTPANGVKLQKGDSLVFQGRASSPIISQSAPVKENVIVKLTNIRGDGTAEGIVYQGDASELTNPQGYKIEKDIIGEYAGSATYRSPRQELSNALTESTKVVAQIPQFAQDTKNLSGIAVNALDNYNGSIDALEATLANLEQAGYTIQSATQAFAGLDTSNIRYQLNASAQSMGTLMTTLQVIKLINGDVGNIVDTVGVVRNNMLSLSDNLSMLDSVAVKAQTAQADINNIIASGQNTIIHLRAFDVNGARSNLLNINARLNQLDQLNVPMIISELQYLAAAAPNLRDEDISHSVDLLDKFIAGQVIPGERIQILTTSNISPDAVAPLIQNKAGHTDVSLYSTKVGVIEPNARAELVSLLNEVRAVLAGMMSVIVTILLLVLDHTAVMSVICRRRLAAKIKREEQGLLKNLLNKIRLTFTARERQYGMAVGAVLLSAMFVLSGGGIPYLPWIGVPFLGALLGLIVSNYAEKISPISREEVLAGEALGMSFDEIMREIVIPCSRPGLLQKLNRRKLKFK